MSAANEPAASPQPIMTPAGRKRGKPRRFVPARRYEQDNPLLDALLARSAPPAKPSAILSSRRLEQQQPYFERAVGAVLLGMSIAGTVALFQQGWGMPHLAPLAAGVGLQGVITYVEWAWRRTRLSKAYLAALVVDIGVSVGGYLGVVLPVMIKLFTRAGFSATMSSVGAWLFIVAAAGLLAYLPERILVKD